MSNALSLSHTNQRIPHYDKLFRSAIDYHYYFDVASLLSFVCQWVSLLACGVMHKCGQFTVRHSACALRARARASKRQTVNVFVIVSRVGVTFNLEIIVIGRNRETLNVVFDVVNDFQIQCDNGAVHCTLVTAAAAALPSLLFLIESPSCVALATSIPMVKWVCHVQQQTKT